MQQQTDPHLTSPGPLQKVRDLAQQLPGRAWVGIAMSGTAAPVILYKAPAEWDLSSVSISCLEVEVRWTAGGPRGVAARQLSTHLFESQTRPPPPGLPPTRGHFLHGPGMHI